MRFPLALANQSALEYAVTCLHLLHFAELEFSWEVMNLIALFLSTNLAVVAVLSVVLRLLGIDGQQGIGLLIMAACMGMGGALISLAMSKSSVKRKTGARVIDPESPNGATERWLLETVHAQADRAGIGRPEVAIYDAPNVNAFATGMNRNNALVAVSSGLLKSMTQDEAEAVLGHEVSHVANGDMVTLTLIQGVVNTFVIVLSRVLGQYIDRAIFKSRSGYGPGYFVASMVLQVVFGALASIIVMWFSRRREFRADAGGAELAGRGKMIAALERLAQSHPPALPKEMAALGISNEIKSGFAALFTSHPPLEVRIKALRDAA